MFDIKQLEIKDTAEYHVTNARGEPQFVNGQPVTITVHSPGTKVAAQAQFERQERSSNRLTAAISGRAEKRTESEDRKERAEYLAKLTASLNNFAFEGGPAALYAYPKLRFIADGLEKFYNDMGNFAPDSASVSSNMSGTQPG
jgi:hypothetical protein